MTSKGDNDEREPVRREPTDLLEHFRDHVLLDQGQSLSDRDQSSSERDQTASDHDEEASARDQELSDRQLLDGTDVVAHERSRETRAEISAERLATSRSRDVVAADRAQAADERDRIADERDEIATSRERTAARADEAMDLPDPPTAPSPNGSLEAEANRAKKAHDSTKARDREHAARDRETATRLRTYAARDRHNLP
jgi:hypothetical protein